MTIRKLRDRVRAFLGDTDCSMPAKPVRRFMCAALRHPTRPVAHFKDAYDHGTTYACACGKRVTDVLGDETGFRLGLYEREKTDE